jgi:excisionase family DNA binding protein
MNPRTTPGKPGAARPHLTPEAERLLAAQADATAAPAAAPGTPSHPFAGRSVLHVDEIARHLRVTRQHVTHWIDDGSLAAINVNSDPNKRNRWRIPLESYQAFLKARSV